MNHKFKCAAMVLVILVILLTHGIASVAAAGDYSIERLFPEDMCASTPFKGEFTEENLSHLQKLYPPTALNKLDVLRGDQNGDLMLDMSAKRAEGAVMLVRMLGAEAEALGNKYTHPFTDVASWADPYIGYLYHYDFAKGIGNNLYGSDIYIDEKSYLTFLLRALGYSDENGEDFTWNTVEAAAKQAGLLEPEKVLRQGETLKRLRLSELSWRAMFKYHKKHNQRLLVYLHSTGVIPDSGINELLIKDLRLIDQWLSYLPAFENGYLNHKEKINVTLTKALVDSDMQKYLNNIIERVQIKTGVFSYGYATELWQQGDQYTLHFFPNYDNTAVGDRKLFIWAKQITDEIIKPGMTDYEKEKAIHDFVINTLEYDTSTSDIDKIPETSRSALGALETKKAVCEAYSELMMLLLNRVGIPCRLVTGYADGVPHAWNMVLINGDTYHVDATWNDPVMNSGEGILRYDYFNLTDDELKRDHEWEAKNYPACNTETENYYVKNNLIIDSPEQLVSALQQIAENRKKECSFKLRGFGAADYNISQIMKDVSKAVDYALLSYKYSFTDDTQIFSLHDIEYLE